MSVLLNLLGRRFGRLTVVSRAENDKYNRAKWECVCDCGGRKIVQRQCLLLGTTSSCGCMRGPKPTHGLTHTKEYQAWSMMKRRCADPNNKNFRSYGGRGICVCDRWKESFPAFIEDMGPRPSQEHQIDRINNDGNYEPGNCRWATPTEQQNNKANNRYVEYRGSRMSVADAVRVSGSAVPRFRVYQRLNAGWPVERAIETPTGSA